MDHEAIEARVILVSVVAKNLQSNTLEGQRFSEGESLNWLRCFIDGVNSFDEQFPRTAVALNAEDSKLSRS